MIQLEKKIKRSCPKRNAKSVYWLFHRLWKLQMGKYHPEYFVYSFIKQERDENINEEQKLINDINNDLTPIGWANLLNYMDYLSGENQNQEK